MAAILSEEVVSVRHWTDRLFSFVVTRHPSFRFEAGQFAMIGLELDGKPLMRARFIHAMNSCMNIERVGSYRTCLLTVVVNQRLAVT